MIKEKVGKTLGSPWSLDLELRWMLNKEKQQFGKVNLKAIKVWITILEISSN